MIGWLLLSVISSLSAKVAAHALFEQAKRLLDYPGQQHINYCQRDENLVGRIGFTVYSHRNSHHIEQGNGADQRGRFHQANEIVAIGGNRKPDSNGRDDIDRALTHR